MKVAFEMHARQPDVELIKDFAVRHTDRAKQFRLGNFKEANVRAVEDDVGGVDITPTHALFDSELLRMIHRIHRNEVSTGSDSDRVSPKRGNRDGRAATRSLSLPVLTS